MKEIKVPEGCEACPNRVPEKHQQRIGQQVGAIALMFFVGAWVARGYFDRKTPTVFEIGFAIACVYLAKSDPNVAQNISMKAISAILPGQGSNSDVS